MMSTLNNLRHKYSMSYAHDQLTTPFIGWPTNFNSLHEKKLQAPAIKS